MRSHKLRVFNRADVRIMNARQDNRLAVESAVEGVFS